MEYTFSVNHLLADNISVVTGSFVQLQKFMRSNYEAYKKQFEQIIDDMGINSSKAQQLPSVITSFKRLQYSDHRLYILKDSEANSMKGAIIGILKVGKKKLFIFDMVGKQHEMEPLCVLDFYVHESRQRHGYGKKLFDFMLHNENILPVHFAIDKPSAKFSAFLAKHYGLKDNIPQMNNFVVYHGFFRDRGSSAKKSENPRNSAYGRQISGGSSSRVGSSRSPVKENISKVVNNSENIEIILPMAQASNDEHLNHILAGVASNTYSRYTQQQSSRPAANAKPPSGRNSANQIRSSPTKQRYSNDTENSNDLKKGFVELQNTSVDVGGRMNMYHNGKINAANQAEPILIQDDFDKYRQRAAQNVLLRASPERSPSLTKLETRGRVPDNAHFTPLSGGMRARSIPNLHESSSPVGDRRLPTSAMDVYSYQSGLQRHYSHTRLW